MLAGLLLVTVDVAANSAIRSYMRHWRSYVIKSFYPEISWEEESLTVHSPVCMEQTDAGGNAEGRIWCAVWCCSGPNSYFFIHTFCKNEL